MFLDESLSGSTFGGRCILSILIAVWIGITFSTVKEYNTLYLHPLNYTMANGELFGGDFIAFYAAGRLTTISPQTIYDWPSFLEELKAMMGADYKVALVYAYPPFLLLLFAPLSYLTFHTAVYLWWSISVIAALYSIFKITSLFETKLLLRLMMMLFPAAFVPFSIDCLAGGQTSVLGMLVASGYLYYRQRRNDRLAGLWLGLGVYKPPLFIFLGLSLLLEKRFRIIVWALFSALFLLSLSIPLVGVSGCEQYLHSISGYIYGAEILPGKKLPTGQGIGALAICLNLFASYPVIGWSIYGFLYALFLFLFHTSAMKDPASVENRSYHDAALMTASLFFSIQMLKYDLAILLIPATLVILQWYDDMLSKAHFPTGRYFLAPLVAIFFLLLLPYYDLTIGAFSIKGLSLLLAFWIGIPFYMRSLKQVYV